MSRMTQIIQNISALIAAISGAQCALEAALFTIAAVEHHLFFRLTWS